LISFSKHATLSSLQFVINHSCRCIHCFISCRI